MWHLFCHCLLLISLFGGSSGRMRFVIVAFPDNVDCHKENMPIHIYRKFRLQKLKNFR